MCAQEDSQSRRAPTLALGFAGMSSLDSLIPEEERCWVWSFIPAPWEHKSLASALHPVSILSWPGVAEDAQARWGFGCPPAPDDEQSSGWRRPWSSDKTTENVTGPGAIFICKDQHLILSYLPQNVT